MARPTASECRKLFQRHLATKYKNLMGTDRHGMKAAEYLAKVDPDDKETVMTFLRHVDRPGAGAVMRELWMSSILSGTGTHLRNVVGNSGFLALLETAVRPARAAIDAPVSKIANKERDFYLREVIPAWTGAFRGMGQGFARAVYMFNHGGDMIERIAVKGGKVYRNQGQIKRLLAEGKLQEGQIRYLEETAGKYEAPRSAIDRIENPRLRRLGRFFNAPLRALSAADGFFKSMAFSAELHALAARQAAKDGFSGTAYAARYADLLDNPTDEILEAAKRYEDFATFNDEMSEIGKGMLYLREKVPVAGVGFMPFIKIADRLIVRGFELTPFGMVKAGLAAKRGQKKEFVDLTARAAIGSMAMLGLGAYAFGGDPKNPRLTAWAPKDRSARERFYEEGKQPWSVRIGGKWYPFAQLEPIAYPLAIVASLHQRWLEGGEKPDESTIQGTAIGMARFVLDKTYMSSLGDTMVALERDDPRVLARIGTRQATGLIPYSSLIRSTAMAMDPELKEPQDALDYFQQQFPWASEHVPEQVTRFGEPVMPVTGRSRGFAATGTPLAPSHVVEDQVAQELLRHDVGYGRVTRDFKKRDGSSVRLSRAQQLAWQRARGQAARERLEQLLTMEEYWKLGAKSRAKALRRAIDRGTERARFEFGQTLTP